MNPLQKWRLENPGKSVERKDPFLKLRENPTRRNAINAFCVHCMGWEEGKERPPGVVNDVKGCTDYKCPLYDYRPYKYD